MNQQQLYQYVESYLRALDCPIIEQDSTYLTTQLTVDVDKQIMNRPYYWMFVERTCAEPQPARLTFVFDEENLPENIRGELLKFGCWRLHQIFQSAKQNGQFIRLYEEVSQSASTQGLVPWLIINYTISFISDQKKDLYYPLGFNLVSGQIMTDFDRVLEQYHLTPKIPDYHFTLRPIFSLQSSIKLIEQHVNNYLLEHNTKWADEANQRLNEETELIRSFIIDDEILQKRLAEVEQYRPRIEVNPINVGLVYLQTNPLSKIRLN